MCNHTLLNYRILQLVIHLYQKIICIFACLNSDRMDRLNCLEHRAVQSLNDYLK